MNHNTHIAISGIIFGKFFPLHTGHINMIFEALQITQELHIVICSETERDIALYQQSQMQKMPTIAERIKWLTKMFALYPHIHIHHLNEDGIPPYPHGWEPWTKRCLMLIQQQKINVDLIFSSEPQDVQFYQELFNAPVQLIDPKRSQFNVSATKIRATPFIYWDFIPHHIRAIFTKAIVLYEENNETFYIADQLARIYNTRCTQINNQTYNQIEEILSQSNKLSFFTVNEPYIKLFLQSEFLKKASFYISPDQPTNIKNLLESHTYNLITLSTKYSIFEIKEQIHQQVSNLFHQKNS